MLNMRIGGALNSIVSTINNRAQNQLRVQSQTQQAVTRAMVAQPQSAESSQTAHRDAWELEATCQTSHRNAILRAAESFGAAVTRVYRLQMLIDAFDMLDHYEGLQAAEQNPLRAVQYQRSITAWQEATSFETLQRTLGVNANFGGVDRTGTLMGDLSCLEFLGLANFESMTNDERRAALVNARDAAIARIGSAGHSTAKFDFSTRSFAEVLERSGNTMINLLGPRPLVAQQLSLDDLPDKNVFGMGTTQLSDVFGYDFRGIIVNQRT